MLSTWVSNAMHLSMCTLRFSLESDRSYVTESKFYGSVCGNFSNALRTAYQNIYCVCQKDNRAKLIRTFPRLGVPTLQTVDRRQAMAEESTQAEGDGPRESDTETPLRQLALAIFHETTESLPRDPFPVDEE